MSAHTFLSTNLLIAYTAYFLGTASPGPSNLATMSMAAHHGRKAALVFASGVISGSMFWAVVASTGVSAALVAYSQFIVAVKIFGSGYLLWLACKSARTALAPAPMVAATPPLAPSYRWIFSRGALLHLTNPKAVLVWVSIVALSSSNPSSTHQAVIPGCALIGCMVFGGYALLFSMPAARRLYARARRMLDGCLAVLFGFAGFRLLASRL